MRWARLATISLVQIGGKQLSSRLCTLLLLLQIHWTIVGPVQLNRMPPKVRRRPSPDPLLSIRVGRAVWQHAGVQLDVQELVKLFAR